jgi:hypothetical protein
VTTDDGRKEYTLLDSLSIGDWLKLPLAVMSDVGAAVETLGGLLRITDRETFCAVERIAGKARLPVATVRKHLIALNVHGWILNEGRGVTRSGALRRTSSIKVTKKTKSVLAPYGASPWWSRCHFKTFGRMTWGTRAVLSVVMARLMSLSGAVERQDGHGADADDVLASIENMGGIDRYQFALSALCRHTGLSRETVVSAKRELARRHIVMWYGGESDDGGNDRHRLVPNEDLRIVTMPGDPGYVRLHFEW